MKESKRNRLDVFELWCLRSMVRVPRMGRVRDEEVRRLAVIMRKMSERVDMRVLSWYGHLMTMGEERLTKRLWKAEVSGPNLRGRNGRGWMEGVERALGLQGMSVEQGGERVSDNRVWIADV